MIEKQVPNWFRIGVFSSGGNIERIAHAGLSSNGRLCFVSGEDDYPFMVWDIKNAKIIWVANEFRRHHSDLSGFVKNEHIEIDEEPAIGSYRVFGINENYALQRNVGMQIEIKLEETLNALLLTKFSTNQEIQSLNYEAFSGDWTFASFSDDGSVIAVMEPYYITFFGWEQP